MKNIMNLCLVMASCISATTYCAERLNADQIIRKSLATGEPIDKATLDTILQQQKDLLKEQDQMFRKTVIQQYVDANQPIPARIIKVADAEIADLARQHNQKFQLRSHQTK